MRIKNMISCIVLAAVMTLPSLAMAANEYTENYDATTKALTGTMVDAGGRQTVLIAKVDNENDFTIADDDIVYVDQNDDMFSTSINFMLLNTITDGLYRVSLGGGSSETPTVGYFTIGAVEEEDTVTATAIETKEYVDSQGNTKYRKGFSINVTGNKTYSKIVVYNNGVAIGTWSLSNTPTVTGNGSIDYGIQIYNIPDNITAEALTISLSE